MSVTLHHKITFTECLLNTVTVSKLNYYQHEMKKKSIKRLQY